MAYTFVLCFFTVVVCYHFPCHTYNVHVCHRFDKRKNNKTTNGQFILFTSLVIDVCRQPLYEIYD